MPETKPDILDSKIQRLIKARERRSKGGIPLLASFAFDFLLSKTVPEIHIDSCLLSGLGLLEISRYSRGRCTGEQEEAVQVFCFHFRNTELLAVFSLVAESRLITFFWTWGSFLGHLI